MDITLKYKVIHDEYTNFATRMFDIPIQDEYSTVINNSITPPSAEWNIGLIVGPSGSGKTTLLKQFNVQNKYTWNEKPLISNFNNISPEKAGEILCAVGLSTIPTWIRPYHTLSNGEQFRADIAKIVSQDNEISVIDEFTSVVDRNVAKAASNSIQKYIRRSNKKIVLASCHYDIIDWLQPDWIYNPIEGITKLMPRGSLHRPKIELKIFRSKYEAWHLFKQHHYLSSDLNKSAKCFICAWNEIPVAISAILSFPHAKIKNAWRESRTVVLPDYQGFGIGVRLSDFIGSVIKNRGGRFYSRTTHPAMISYRSNSKNWRITGKGKTSAMGKNSTKQDSWKQDNRFCYSFEYIGDASSNKDANVFWEKC